MSITRTPRLLSRREEIEDAKRTAALIAGLLAFAAFSFVGALTLCGGMVACSETIKDVREMKKALNIHEQLK